MSTEDNLETYTHLPVHLDPATKALSASSSVVDPSITEALQHINALHTQFKSLETPNHAPPPPLPVAPKRTAQIQKMRESASTEIRKGNYQNAARLFGLAVDMAAGRPSWEPVGLMKEELATCYMERSNAYVLARMWPEGWVDAQCSTECKRGRQQGPNGQVGPGNPRAFVLGGKCLVEMARWDEAVTWLEKGLNLEGGDGPDGQEMIRLLKEAQTHTGKISAP